MAKREVVAVLWGRRVEPEQFVELARAPDRLRLVIPRPDGRAGHVQRLALSVIALAQSLLAPHLLVDVLPRAAVPMYSPSGLYCGSPRPSSHP